MRHRQKGRHLGRTSPHRAALMRNLSRALILTCDREAEIKSQATGRIRTTLAKAKECRPFIEKLVTTAIKAKRAEAEAAKQICSHERGSDAWKEWRKSEAGQVWLKAQSLFIQRQRQLFDVFRSRSVVKLLVNQIAPKFLEREGGYTRVVRVARRRLADGAFLAYLEFVGEATRLKVKA